MSFSLTSYNIFDRLEVTISANALSGLTWLPYTIRFDEISADFIIANDPILDFSSVSATYVTSPYGTVNWGISTTDLNTNIISVTAFNDSLGICICAIDANSDTDVIYFYPYRLEHQLISSTDFLNIISSVYIQVSTKNMMNIPIDTEIQWISETNNVFISAGLGNNINEYKLSDNSIITGYAPSATQITLNYSDTGHDINLVTNTTILNDKYILSPISSYFIRNIPQTEIIFKPGITIFTEETQSTYIILSAIQSGIPITESTTIQWNVLNDSIDIISFTGSSLDSLYTLGAANTGIGYIKLSATDLSKSYQYQLSSYTGVETGWFRPYSNITDTTNISAQIIKLPNENNTYKYAVKLYSIINGIVSNIPAAQRMWWESDDISASAKLYSDDSTPYIFGTIGYANTIDSLYIRIISPIVVTAPTSHTIKFKIYIAISEGSYNIYEFYINYNDWISDEILKPNFRFQYETTEQTTIYRPVTTSALYNITYDSIIPLYSEGYIIYTFNNGICSIPYEITDENNIDADIQYEFNTTNECICSINMMICSKIDGMDEYIVREAPTKQIIFANIPVASSFEVFVSYYWNGSNWVTTDVFAPISPLSAFGFCHSESYILRSNTSNITQSRWTIQDINHPDNYVQTLVNDSSAIITFKPGLDSTYLCVCAAVFNNLLSSNMPTKYYDSIEGIPFKNFSSTFEPITSTNRQHIRIIGPNDIGLTADITNITYLKYPVPNNIYIKGAYTTLDSIMPFRSDINSFYFILTSEFWEENERALLYDDQTASILSYINVDYIGNSHLGVPVNEKTEIHIIPRIDYTPFLLSAHPVKNDWCFDNFIFTGNSNAIIEAYPMVPTIYTPNRYSLTGSNIKYENMTQYFSDISDINGIKQLTWTDRDSAIVFDSCSPYNTSYVDEGKYDLQLRTIYNLNSSTYSLENIFPDIISIQNQYISADSNITRIFGSTKLELPYNKEECKIAINEWLTADTFNAVIRKLYDNLIYLENMSHLYDAPPTEYIGWYGTLYYTGSAKRTRWFTNIPHNSYGYDHPEYAIDNIFNNLQSCFVRRNNIYVSNGTSVYILSSDLWGKMIDVCDYKTLGDDFGNIRSIYLDSENRIYLLDSYDDMDLSKGSKNRILVYNYNIDIAQWNLLYEWGGLGGPGAKNKFNKPSDFYIDDDDMLWVADTENKCIKKYTRTGSWVKNITSTYFSDNEKPMSVIYTDNKLFVLTDNNIIKFNEHDEVIGVYAINAGSKKIRKCQDGNFLYIVYSDHIEKVDANGIIAGTIADEVFFNYEKKYRDVFHDEFRNLYVINKNHILKYVDLLTLVSLKLDTQDSMWNIDQLLVKKNEYIQDWVINRCIQRLWDNIEIFRRSLIGKFGYRTYQNTISTTIVSAIPLPTDPAFYCNNDWLYTYGKIIPYNIIFENIKPVIVSFKIDEYIPLVYKKEDIYIGMNELHTADVYNRVISKLYECENIILKMIND